jgi:hypothetical protein
MIRMFNALQAELKEDIQNQPNESQENTHTHTHTHTQT